MKIYLDTIGCRLNQAEIEGMAQQFRAAGHSLTAEAAGADLAVVNTCAVTAGAAADSRQKIRHAAQMGAGEIIVTGCWSTLQPGAAAGLPHVVRVVPNEGKDSLVAEALSLPRQAFEIEPLARQPLPGLHRRTRAFIKVQDGCDNACTFCVTTVARGAGRSLPVGAVLADVRAALAGGAQEIVLTGVHLGSWGHDFSTSASTRLRHSARSLKAGAGDRLPALIRAILDETDVPRLRLSSLEPWDLDEDFFPLWDASALRNGFASQGGASLSTGPRLMPHLHLPLQSGSPSVLKRMLRKTTPEAFRALAAAARAAIPDLALTTDVIAGFPGETEAEFAETLEFVRKMEFAGGHVFTYSSRPGTAAARMKDHLPGEVKRERGAQLRQVFDERGRAYREKFIGRTLPVLWESVTELGQWGWQMEGHSGNFIRVTAQAASPRWNRVDAVRLTGLAADGVTGEIIRQA